MGDASGELADCFQFLRLPALGLDAVAFGYVNPDAGDQFTPRPIRENKLQHQPFALSAFRNLHVLDKFLRQS